MFVSSNGHTERQRRLGKDVGERTDQEVEMGSFLAKERFAMNGVLVLVPVLMKVSPFSR